MARSEDLTQEISPSPSQPNTKSISGKITQWLSNLQVGQKIGLGYAIALSIAILGTSIGIIIGNSYQKEAEEAVEDALEEIQLLKNVKNHLSNTQLHHKRLIVFLDQPKLFQQEVDSFQEGAAKFNQSWSQFKNYYENEAAEESPEELEKVASLQENYDGAVSIYVQQTENILGKINSFQLNSEEIITAQKLLLDFYNSPTVLKILDFGNDLEIALDVFIIDEQEDVINSFATASTLRIQVITLSMALSTVIAIILAMYTSRTITSPLRKLTQVAEKITQNSNFSQQVSLNTQDEFGVLGNAFNQLLERAKELLEAQKQRTIELKQINEKLKATQKQMIAQEKLASLGSLTAGIAHEIRNPLNFVNNFAELSVDLTEELREELETQQDNLDPEIAEELIDIIADLSTNANKINHHGKRAEKIVSNMLLHSRSGESNWELTNINSLLAEAINLAYHGMRAKDSSFNVTLDTDYDETIGKLNIVPQDINRVFLNVVGNACYAVHAKKKANGDDFVPLIKVRSRNLGEKIEIRIRDNGDGMSSEVIDKVFNHFFTTKPTGEGTGLGLSLSYEIITQEHQGELRVESEFGMYAEFIMVLPNKKS